MTLEKNSENWHYCDKARPIGGSSNLTIDRINSAEYRLEKKIMWKRKFFLVRNGEKFTNFGVPIRKEKGTIVRN